MTTNSRTQLTSGAVYLESSGDPLGPLVLCVHGLSANCRSFDRFVPALAGAGYHVVTMDLRGRGHSEVTPPGTYGWDSHVRDLLEIADSFGADSFDLIGHSMGAFIGMALAAEHPGRCRRLVLIDALGVPEPSALGPIAQSVSRLGRTYPSVADALSYVQASGTISPWNEFWENYFRWELEPVADGVRIRTDLTAASEDSVYATQQDVYALWPRLRCPVLAVRATKPITPGVGLIITQVDAERFATEVANAAVIDVDADHYSIMISPPVLSAVEEFLGAAAESGSGSPTFPGGLLGGA